jgi:hypothetical protein
VFADSRNFDDRALQTPIIVSKDGLVISGNNRTMSAQLAATDGNNGAYKEALTETAQNYGFASEQIAKMKNPLVVLETEDDIP